MLQGVGGEVTAIGFVCSVCMFEEVTVWCVSGKEKRKGKLVLTDQ